MRPCSAVALVALLGSLGAPSATAKEHFPEFTAPLVDAAGVVPEETEQRIDQQLLDYQEASGNQVAVAVVKTTGDASLEDYSIDLAREWGVGKKDEDNGVLLLIAYDDRRLRIEVGSGLEDELTDLESGRIIREQITPLLRAGDVGGAISAGTVAIEQAIGGELAPPPEDANEDRSPNAYIGLLPLILILGGLASFFGRGRSRRRRRGAGWELAMLPILLGSGWGRRDGGYDGGADVGGGGFGGGGFGGGGFGGGGGGGFSGGGASGGW